MTLEERCKLATDCLPQAEYRRRLEALHAELLAAVAAERERCALLAAATVCDTHLPTGVKIYGTRAAAAIRAQP
jgi:hypothetical protein